MISVTAIAASPTTVAPGGGQSTITPTLTDPDQTATVTVTTETGTGSAQVLIHEAEIFSVNPTDILASGLAKPGKVVATVDQGGTLAVGTGGTFIFTAS